MSSTHADLTQLAQRVKKPPYTALRGRFHSHLTVNVGPERLAALRDFCARHRAKFTVVDLADHDGRQQRDVMLTRYHRGAEEAVSQIVSDLTVLTLQLNEAGFTVVRAKLEHESEPSIATFDAAHYHEVHIKLAIPAARFEEERSWLQQIGPAHGFVPSSNPRERTSQTVMQFVNLRIYEGDRSSADTQVADLLAVLRDRGLYIAEVKQETTVFDTHRDLDRWWA